MLSITKVLIFSMIFCLLFPASSVYGHGLGIDTISSISIQEKQISDDILNCEYGGILGTVAGIIGTIQANEVLKKILNIGKSLNGNILILDLLNLNFRKVKLNKLKNV